MKHTTEYSKGPRPGGPPGAGLSAPPREIRKTDLKARFAILVCFSARFGNLCSFFLFVRSQALARLR